MLVERGVFPNVSQVLTDLMMVMTMMLMILMVLMMTTMTMIVKKMIFNFFRLFPFGEWLQLSGGPSRVYHDFVCEDIEDIDDDIDEIIVNYDEHDNHDCDDIDDAGVADAEEYDAVADIYDADADTYDADADADMQESDEKECSPSRATVPPKSSELSETKTQPRWCTLYIMIPAKW